MSRSTKLKRAPPEGEIPRSASDRIVSDVVAGLYDGRYAPGQRLVEPDLMRRYGVGRSTVREAIKRLSAEGVAAAHPFRGAQIRRLSRREARDILLILELMIGLAARLAASNIRKPGRRRRFNDAYRELIAFAHENECYEMVRARDRFYRIITRIGDNAELLRLLPSTQVHLVRTQLRISSEQRFDDYRRIGEAILEGDEKAAEAAARKHIRRSTAMLDELPNDAFDSNEGHSLKLANEDMDDA
ncbi:GntR family transcriptional regulator [Bradyrhizobium diazoefficiens]|nr:GntR family transcriptional regulator [Bradyrhizobium diazoefficiens]QQN65447.1 GntR family transcriptional regulator [Bradyrhizobium diazoefficiens]